MDARTYRVPNLREALELIRRELGPEAALINTRRVRRQGLGGWLTGATELEVTAAADVSIPSRLPPEYVARESSDSDAERPSADDASSDDVSSDDAATMFAPVRAAAAYASAAARRDKTDARSVDEDRESRREFLQGERSAAGVDTDRCDRLKFAGPLSWRPGRSHWVALVGPTGVGKTTTLAKLAAEYRLDRRLEVGLVTLDTYRVNGAAHLKTYAEILDLPLEVVDSPERMSEVAEALTDRYDVVLLDTGGQGPRDDRQRRLLRSLLEAARPDEIHLTLSATGSPAVFRDAVRRFAEFRPTALTLTKLDEAPSEADLIAAVEQVDLPLAYLTFGQQVPEDIAVADPTTAAAWLGPVAATSVDERRSSSSALSHREVA